MKEYRYIKVDRTGPAAHIRLDRPEKHHALNPGMIRELMQVLDELDQREGLRLITLSAPGRHFCAGADLQWMREGREQDREQLMAESLELAGLFNRIATCSKLFLCAVQGRVMGGAIGLVAAADLVLAEESARFAFSEVKLGLVPATIAPYVLKRAGRERSRAWMLSGRTFSAAEAREGGLVHFLCPEGSLDREKEVLVRELLDNEQGAMEGIDALLDALEKLPKQEIMEYTARTIARYRSSGEAQQRMNAFLDKSAKKQSHGH